MPNLNKVQNFVEHQYSDNDNNAYIIKDIERHNKSILNELNQVKDNKEQYNTYVKNSTEYLDNLSKHMFNEAVKGANFDDLNKSDVRKNLAKFNNFLSDKIVSSILFNHHAQDIADMYSFWIDVAEQALKNNNFELAQIVYSAITNIEVRRVISTEKSKNDKGEIEINKKNIAILLSDTVANKAEDLKHMFVSNGKNIRNKLGETNSKNFGPLSYFSDDIYKLNLNREANKRTKNESLTKKLDEVQSRLNNTFNSYLKQSKSVKGCKHIVRTQHDLSSDYMEKSDQHRKFLVPFAYLKKQLKDSSHISDFRSGLFNQCHSLKDLCFAAVVSKKSSIFHVGSSCKELIKIINNDKKLEPLIKMLRPSGGDVRVRDLRAFALGQKEPPAKWSDKDRKNVKYFSSIRVKCKNKQYICSKKNSKIFKSVLTGAVIGGASASVLAAVPYSLPLVLAGAKVKVAAASTGSLIGATCGKKISNTQKNQSTSMPFFDFVSNVDKSVDNSM
ncbi:MAG: hypothetical protein EP298_05455 [Gammaproteobacteria bacterium]|nr:MAG: hypothetical protein EP298_05455 [Gammaproteobacteria bacterium]UTW43244.1 hypothetical protein KFE69_03620 [bacterium SCSIO 12844]